MANKEANASEVHVLELHLQSGRMVWQEEPRTWGTYQYKDLEDWSKEVTAKRAKQWQQGHEFEHDQEGLEKFSELYNKDAMHLGVGGIVDTPGKGLGKGKLGKGKASKGKGKGKGKTGLLALKDKEEEPEGEREEDIWRKPSRKPGKPGTVLPRPKMTWKKLWKRLRTSCPGRATLQQLVWAQSLEKF